MSPVLRRASAAVAAVAFAITLSACTSQDAGTQAYLNGEDPGYITSDGAIAEFPEEQRGDPVDFAGVDQEGETIDSEQLRGDVVVVNFWYAACGPCRVEAPYLEEVYEDHKDDGVAFVGVNTSDLADTAKSFMVDYDVTYPSIIDQQDGAAKRAFALATPINSTPTTLVLDKEGRVAARILGAIDSASVLDTIVTELQDAAQ